MALRALDRLVARRAVGRRRPRDPAGLDRRRGGTQVTPRDVAERAGRAGAGALGLAVAQEALRRLLGLRVDRRHLPRARDPADAAAYADLGVDDACAGRRVVLDGAGRARLCAGDRVRALLAGVGLRAPVAVGALARPPLEVRAGVPRAVAVELHTGEVRARDAVVELAAGKLAAVACHAPGGLVEQDALGIGSDRRVVGGAKPHAREHCQRAEAHRGDERATGQTPAACGKHFFLLSHML